MIELVEGDLVDAAGARFDLAMIVDNNKMILPQISGPAIYKSFN
jgi:hypothetical protein